MKRLITSILIGCTFAIMVGCGWKICPDYPEYMGKYCPYKVNEVLRFHNNETDTIAFTVVRLYTHHESKAHYCAECLDIIEVELKHDSITIEYNFSASCGNMGGFSCVTYYDKMRDYAQSENITGVSNPATESIINDTLRLQSGPNSRITAIKIAKNIGLIEFRDTLTNYTWRLIK